jgi:CheY-like chemotaxis protein
MIGMEETEILLVEDDSDDLDMLLHALRRIDLAHRIHVARDGVEALDFVFCRGSQSGRAIERVPRMILLDLKLPRVDGLEVLAQVKSDPRTRTIPTVILSSSREEIDVAECYRRGGNSYIVKPVNFDAFVLAMQQLGRYWLLLNQPPESS